MNLRESLLEILSGAPGTDWSQAELMKELKIPRSLKRRLSDVVDALLEEGAIRETPGHRFLSTKSKSPRPDAKTLSGVVHFSASGNGFVSVEGRDEDLFVPASRLDWALPGDEVEIRLLPPKGRQGFRPPFGKLRAGSPTRGDERRDAAEVVRVLKRGREQWVGKLHWAGKEAVLVAREGDLELNLPVDATPSKALEGQWIAALAPGLPGPDGRGPKAVFQSVLGGADTPGLDTLILIKKAGLREEFPSDALREAGNIGDTVPPEAYAGRKDLREQTVFTIDGADAKDFDDAVSLELLAGGGCLLGVHIADVSHYVRPDAPLDKEAFERGTSVYLPDRVLPMLPEALSNGLCSLKEGVDRLTVSALMTYDASGRLIASTFADSVICSSKRFTYDQVQAVLDNKETLEGPKGKELSRVLFLMQQLAQKLVKHKEERGALDFNFPETKAELDDKGEVIRLYRRERIFAHQLIEEFMIAANQAVAKALKGKAVSTLNRVHEEPDAEKLAETLRVLARFKLGAPTSSPVRPKDLQKLLKKAEGRPEERLAHTLVLRSLRLARYTPEDLGHFGLALEDYCHFTSPIRRYPDLLVHRCLKAAVIGKGQAVPPNPGNRSWVETGEACSIRERKAESCERDCVKAKQIRYLNQHLDETFPATITSVTVFGFFAEIDPFPAEGLVHIRTLEDDFYSFDTNRIALVGGAKKKAFEIGMKVQVKVKRADWEALQVDFTLV
jgi:ribonuclease R